MALKKKLFRRHHVLSSFLTAFTNRVLAREDDEFNKQLLEKAATMNNEKFKRIALKETIIYKHFENLISKSKYQFIIDFGHFYKKMIDMFGYIMLNEMLIEELLWLNENYAYTYHHTLASTAIAMRLAFDYFMDEDVAMTVGECSLVKDIGLGHVPPEIVNKTGKLTKNEQLLIQEHPIYSALLLAHYYKNYLMLPVECALNHHEDKLGKGYPRGIGLERIEVHIVKFADTFDALITARPFRNYFKLDDAFMISEAEIKLGNLDESLLPLIRSYHINFQSMFHKQN